MHVFQPLQLLLKPRCYHLRPGFGLGAFTQFLNRFLVVIVCPQVLLDGLHLLLKEVLTLPLIDLLGRTTTDIRFDSQFLQIPLQNSQQRFTALHHRVNLQQTLLLVGRHVVDRADIIDHRRIVFDALNRGLQPGRNIVLLVHDLHDRLADTLGSCFELGFLAPQRHSFFHLQSLCLQLAVFIDEVRSLHTMITLKNSHHRIFTHLRNRNDLQHTRHDTGRVEIVFLRIGYFAVFLSQQD